MFRSIPIAAVLILFAGCGSPERTAPVTSGSGGPTPTPTGVQLYTCTAYDAGGTLVVSGELAVNLSVPDSEKTISISGTWTTRKVGPGGPVGPQVGTGKLAGSVSGAGEIRIDLNPGWADNNVVLSAHEKIVDLDELQGSWSAETFVGTIASGTFRAVLR